MKHGSLFSGIGGFDLASQWMGWKNVFHCENNPFGKRVLQYYWPNAISYDDIRTTDFTIHRGKIDILTGGFPCQPFSLAGKRKGHLYGARRHRKNYCENCGSTERLQIHHKDENWKNNSESNLATLCPSCHMKWHWSPWKLRGQQEPQSQSIETNQ